MKRWRTAVFAMLGALAGPVWAGPRITTDKGIVEGRVNSDGKVRIFEGIPYAQPPIGELRWKAPQPAKAWMGVKQTTSFAPRAMQGRIFDDMVFRDKGNSEDCLYLNVWTPAQEAGKKLPVMVWFHGGGFVAGASSEPRQDGENLARKGVVVVSLNYRMGAFGFFAYPELTAESGTHSSGNYGLMDQVAALQWVQKNIAAFGGDPHNVTIFGESAGSFSVSVLMASPLTKGLFHKAIGESGSLLGASRAGKSLAQAEKDGLEFAKALGANSLKDLRAIPAERLLDTSFKGDTYRFKVDVDGKFLTEPPALVYKKGKQRHVPLLAGWNADEAKWHSFFKGDKPNKENYIKHVKEEFGSKAKDFLKLYPAGSDEEAVRSSEAIDADQFIAFATWKWIEAQSSLKGVPVYRYQFDQPIPAEKGQVSPGAHHSCEIEFVFGALDSRHVPWSQADRKVSELVMDYWINFAKTGDPNGPDLPKWPRYSSKAKYPVMHLSSDPGVQPDKHRARYQFLEKWDHKK